MIQYTVPTHLRLKFDEVMLLDASTEPERCGLSVGGSFDLQGHTRAGESNRRATAKRL